MLHHHNGQPKPGVQVPNELGEISGLLSIHPCRWFVQQEDARLRRQSTGNLQLALKSIRQRGCWDPMQIRQTERGQMLKRSLLNRPLLPEERRGAEDGLPETGTTAHALGSAHVVQHRHSREEPDVLERPRDAERRYLVRRQPRDLAAVKHNPPRGGPQEPGDHIEQCGFTRPVRADHPENLSLAQIQIVVG